MSPGDEDQTPLLTGIVVHWRNEEQLAELTAAWPRDPRFELLVVDNGSANLGSRSPLGPARLVQPGGNLGFAGGANAGIAAARAPLVLLLNPDAVPEEGALDRAPRRLRRLARRRRPGTAADRPGRRAAVRLAAPAATLRLGAACCTPFPFGGAPAAGSPSRPPGAPVEQPAAAALALRRSAVEAIGGFDAGFYPAWFEDVDLARRLRAAGAVLRYWPSARFRHGLGGTVPRSATGRSSGSTTATSRAICEKHHGRAWALAARPSLVLGVLIRLLLLPLRRPQPGGVAA